MLLKKIKDYSQSDFLTGRVSINEKTCTGCRQCISICPASALVLNSQNKCQMKRNPECISCGDCCAVCATNSIKITRFYKIPSGVYQTMGRRQVTGTQSYPRPFSDKETPNKKEKKNAT